ncbi:MAG: class I SAM-dependent methyltransferase [Polyangiaceae bacterium]
MRPLLPAFFLALAACGGASAPPPVAPCKELPVPPEPSTCGRATTPATPVAQTAAAAPAPAAPAPTPIAVPPDIEKLVAASDRSDPDKGLDSGRHPGELLAFLGLAPGARVEEIGAGTGYTTELLSRAVGPKGKVYGQNSPGFLKFVGKAWEERLHRPAMKGVVRVDREFDAPFPPDAKNLDVVINVLTYHDTTWLGVDRDKMNKAVFDALKAGGQYVIVDHAAADGRGADDAKSLHRIEKKTVVEEIERAGFKAAGEGDFLRNPGDAHDWNAAPGASGDKRGTSDRFVVKFVKPAADAKP